MVLEKSELYTGTGDDGTTSLVGGTRVQKSDIRVNLYGTIDELNSFMGLAVCFLRESDKWHDEADAMEKIQQELLRLGSLAACPKEKREAFKIVDIDEKDILWLEKRIDNLDSKLPKLTAFIVPGGSMASAYLHICRTVCRRAERKMIQLNSISSDEIPVNYLKYINRMSDYFFCFARSASQYEIIKK